MEYLNETWDNHKNKATEEGIKRVEIPDSNTLVEFPYSTIVIEDQKQHVQKVGYNNADDDIYSIVNINDTKRQIKEEEAQGKSEKPLQSIKSGDNSSFLKKPTEAYVRVLDKLEKIKKSQDKTPPIASIGSTNDSWFKIDNANTMADENATVLIGNLRLETKLLVKLEKNNQFVHFYVVVNAKQTKWRKCLDLQLDSWNYNETLRYFSKSSIQDKT